jgi:hypothetical protein
MHFLDCFRVVMVFDITKHSPAVITAPGAQNPGDKYVSLQYREKYI